MIRIYAAAAFSFRSERPTIPVQKNCVCVPIPFFTIATAFNRYINTTGVMKTIASARSKFSEKRLQMGKSAEAIGSVSCAKLLEMS